MGLNYSIDSAAALLSDGRRVAASMEERFSRVKHDRGFPLAALSFCLRKGGLTAGDVDSFAFFWNPGVHLEPLLTRQSSVVRHHVEYLSNVPNYLLQLLGQPAVRMSKLTLELAGGRRLAIDFVDHHCAHAAAAFFNSPFEEAAILTMDGYGEKTSTTVMHGRGLDVEPVIKVEFPHSIGAFYATISPFLGFKPNSGEGKVMGLASYGDRSLYEALRPLVRLTEDGFELDMTYFNYTLDRTARYSHKLIELLGPPRRPESEITRHHENVATALQLVTEDMMLHMAALARKRVPSKNLCLAGGVALNCVGNRRLQFESGFERLFILPPAGDTGTSLGAAQWVAHVLRRLPRDDSEYLEYLGFENSDPEIEHAIRTSGAASRKLADIEKATARLLADGKIVGWFQGRAEFGPRALGNRSIVTDPRPAAMKDVLNARVKFREPFRPFAPSCLAESCGGLFESGVPSPFMLRVYSTLPHRLKDLGAITHVDGGARVQTVTAQQNPKYYRLIQEFGRLTGVDCILNTSFNIRGEPIVNNVKEALFCFFGTDMDYLVAGDWLVAKNPDSLQHALAPEGHS
jgi:carbamoyltransferase